MYINKYSKYNNLFNIITYELLLFLIQIFIIFICILYAHKFKHDRLKMILMKVLIRKANLKEEISNYFVYDNSNVYHTEILDHLLLIQLLPVLLEMVICF